MRNSRLLMSTLVCLALVACEKSETKPAGDAKAPTTGSQTKPDSAKQATNDGKTHSDHDGHDHSDNKAADGGVTKGTHGGETIALGETTIGKLAVRASRDKGEIKPGGDAPIDVWINGGTGEGVTVVRFWIGIQDASGSIKAKADIEAGKWHTDVEIPSPIPPDAKLWVEVEESGGTKSTGSFSL